MLRIAGLFCLVISVIFTSSSLLFSSVSTCFIIIRRMFVASGLSCEEVWDALDDAFTA